MPFQKEGKSDVSPGGLQESRSLSPFLASALAILLSSLNKFESVIFVYYFGWSLAYASLRHPEEEALSFKSQRFLPFISPKGTPVFTLGTKLGITDNRYKKENPINITKKNNKTKLDSKNPIYITKGFRQYHIQCNDLFLHSTEALNMTMEPYACW